jgi:hypothetical protein
MKLYCVGLPKSGTHSFAQMFASAGFRSAHEPDAVNYIRRLFLYFANGDTSTLDAYLVEKDRHFQVQSSHLDHFAVARLAKLFPTAKFVLTVREPRSWLVSLLSHIRCGGSSPTFDALRELRFRPRGPLQYDLHEASVRELGLYPLRGYLDYWARHVRTVVAAVPPERLLVTEIGNVAEIERFAELPPGTLTPVRAFHNAKRVHLAVPEAYLDQLVNQCCGQAWRESLRCYNFGAGSQAGHDRMTAIRQLPPGRECLAEGQVERFQTGRPDAHVFERATTWPHDSVGRRRESLDD